MADPHGCSAHPTRHGDPPACRCGQPADPGDGTLPPPVWPAVWPELPFGRPLAGQPAPAVVRGPAGRPLPPPPAGFAYPPGGILFLPLELEPERDTATLERDLLDALTGNRPRGEG